MRQSTSLSRARLFAATRPHLEGLEHYDPKRHRREVALFIRWAQEIGLRNSAWALPRRLIARLRISVGWFVICVKDGLGPRAYPARHREALSTVWNTWTYTDDGETLSPVSVTSRSVRLFISGVTGAEDRTATAALLPILREEFASIVMRMQPKLRPRPDWVKVS